MSEPPPPIPRCPRCGGELPPDAIGGLCPRCLMLGAMQATRDGDVAAPMPVPTPEEIAAHFPQLEVLEFLGRGGMGVVYKARQRALGRLVALKLLAPERVDDPRFAERFAHEAKALAALSQPNIVTIYDFGQAGGFYYLLMEFVDGVNLRQAMKAGRFSPEQALAIVPPVCEALQYAHEHGIVHRDIKPENLLLDKEGRVKIADFGIAKIMGAETTGVGLAESQPAGTPQYMAPEQKAHGATDHRADIYSLGVVLYEMLTGELPADKLQPPSKRVQVDVRIDEIVLRALEKAPELRYQTAVEFRTQVETAVYASTDPRIARAWFPLRQIAAALTVTGFFAGFIPLFLVLDFSVPMRNPAIAALGVMLVGTPFLLLGLLAWCSRMVTVTSPDRKGQAGRVLLVAAGVAGILSVPAVAAGVFFLNAMLEDGGNWNPATDEGIVVPLTWLGMFALPWAATVLFRAGFGVGQAEPGNPGEPIARQPSVAPGAAHTMPPDNSGAQVISRTAIVGACWAPVPLLSFVAVAITSYQVRGGPATGPEWWQLAILIPALILGVAGPFGTTILGWVAVSQIRRAGGRIRGMPLAVFDGLFYPLMLLSGVIAFVGTALARMFVDFYLNPSVIGRPNIDPPLHPKVAFWLSQNTGLVALLLIVAIVAVNIVIIRAVLRAVRVPAANSENPAPRIWARGHETALASMAIVLALISGIVGALASLRSQGPWPTLALSLFIAGLAILMALPVRRLTAGKSALIVGALGMAVWPLLAVLVTQGRALSTAAIGVGTSPRPLSPSTGPRTFGPVHQQSLRGAYENMTNWFDLDTAQEFPVPSQADENVHRAMVRSHGADVMGIATATEIGLGGLDTTMLRVASDRWVNATAEEVFVEMASAPIKSIVESNSRITTAATRVSPEDATTLFFRTREGGCGMAQILGPTGELDSIRLGVDESGQPVFNQKVTTFGELDQLLKKRLERNKELSVFINSDTSTRHDNLMAVLAFVRGYGVTNVFLNTVPDPRGLVFRHKLVVSAATKTTE